MNASATFTLNGATPVASVTLDVAAITSLFDHITEIGNRPSHGTMSAIAYAVQPPSCRAQNTRAW